MAKSQNDKLILGLKQEIAAKKKLLNKGGKFSPITNCSIEFGGQRQNINTLGKGELLMLLAQLNSLKKSLFELYPDEKLVISGFDIDDWITDLKSRFESLNVKIEEERLKSLEKDLHNLLSTDTKVSLEIDELKKRI